MVLFFLSLETAKVPGSQIVHVFYKGGERNVSVVSKFLSLKSSDKE